MGGYFQATPAQENERSHHPPFTTFCKNTDFTHLTPRDLYTYMPAKTHIDHWLLRQPTDTPYYTDQNTSITTHTPEYGTIKHSS
jgi:hypothetical protein